MACDRRMSPRWDPEASFPARRVVVGGLPIVALSQAGWAERMVNDCRANAGRTARPLFLSSVNGNVLSRYATDPAFRALLDQADALDADGMPLVIASRLFAAERLPERVATTDFFHVAAKRAEQAGLAFYFVGAEEADSEAAEAVVRRTYPGLRIAGRRNGYFSESEEPELAREIVASGADVVWVGMGVPREQEFIVRNRDCLTGVTWVKSCGGLFKFLAGRTPRAPLWMQRLGLEWLYRMVDDPKHLAWRYLTTNPHAVYLMLRHRSSTLQASGDGRPAT